MHWGESKHVVALKELQQQPKFPAAYRTERTFEADCYWDFGPRQQWGNGLRCCSKSGRKHRVAHPRLAKQKACAAVERFRLARNDGWLCWLATKSPPCSMCKSHHFPLPESPAADPAHLAGSCYAAGIPEPVSRMTRKGYHLWKGRVSQCCSAKPWQ